MSFGRGGQFSPGSTRSILESRPVLISDNNSHKWLRVQYASDGPELGSTEQRVSMQTTRQCESRRVETTRP